MNRFVEIRKNLMEANRFVFYFSCVPDKLFECRKCIPHLLPFCKQLIQNLAIGTGGVMQQHDGTRMDPSEKLVKGFFFGWLRVGQPVNVGKTPEEGMIPPMSFAICRFSVLYFALWRPVEAGHGFACDIFIQSFYTLKFSGKCLLCCNLGHIGVMEGMIADGMASF